MILSQKMNVNRLIQLSIMKCNINIGDEIIGEGDLKLLMILWVQLEDCLFQMKITTNIRF
jgi:hypothetical protein